MDISLQLFSIKEEMKEDFARGLELTRKAGYGGVEFAGYFGFSPEKIKELLAQYQLKAVSTHAGIGRLREAFEEELEYAVKLGYSLIVCPMLPCKTKDQIIEDAEFLEACAQRAAKKGILIGYHNHAHEFVKFDGQYAQDILLETAPSLKFEPDVFWIAYAGVDPVEYLSPLVQAGRICAVHAKELAREGKDNVYIGQGKIDFKAIAKLCPPSVYPYIVEQEEFSSDHFDGISQSYQGLKKVFDQL
ncbi:MAG: sugar phosphate isomerase/epimerase [Treponema sp.]|nr:sugar phosphate isomerase/epimerase [Treponema sp.]